MAYAFLGHQHTKVLIYVIPRRNGIHVSQKTMKTGCVNGTKVLIMLDMGFQQNITWRHSQDTGAKTKMWKPDFTSSPGNPKVTPITLGFDNVGKDGIGLGGDCNIGEYNEYLPYIFRGESQYSVKPLMCCPGYVADTSSTKTNYCIPE